MTTTVETLKEADKRLALGIYHLNHAIGDLSSNPQLAQGSIVDALTDLLSRVGHAGLDAPTVQGMIDAKLRTLTDGASDAYNTFKEIEDLMKADDSAYAAVLQEIAALKLKDTELQSALSLDSNWATTVDRLMTTGRE